MEAREGLAIAMFIGFIGLIFTGFPVAWVLGGLAVLFTALGIIAQADFGIFTGNNGAIAFFDHCPVRISINCDVLARLYSAYILPQRK